MTAKLAILLAACTPQIGGDHPDGPAGGDARADSVRPIDARLDGATSVGAFVSGFPSTENPIDGNGTWITGKTTGLDWNDPETTPGHAFASVESGTPNRYNDSIAHLTTAFGAAQFAQGVVFRDAAYDPTSAKHEVEVLLRFEITANHARGYEVMWGVSGYLAIVRWNGPLGDYTTLYDSGDPGIGKAVENDVLRAAIAGTTITVTKNGASVATVDITSQPGDVWTTGQPGIGFWPVDGAEIDRYGWKHFEAGAN